MEKDQPSLSTSEETNLFCEILVDPMKNFMATLEKRALKNYLQGLENAQIKKKKKNQKPLKQKRKKPNWWSK